MISTIDGFDVQKAGPIDRRYVAANQTERLALTWVYKGLLCYQVDNNTIYKYIGVPPSNLVGDWVAILEAGTPGAPGSVWYDGSGAPGSGLGIINDYYLNVDNGDVYNKTGVSTWSLVGNIKGPAGSSGLDPTYGSIEVTGGATAQGLTSTYALVTQFVTNGPALNVTPDAANDNITLDNEGDYLLHLNADVIGIAAKVYDLVFYIDGVASVVKTTFNCTSNATPVVSMQGVINIVTPGAVVELYAKQTSGGTENLTFVTGRWGAVGVNVKGDTGAVGVAMIHTEHDITFDDAKVTAVEAGTWTPQAPWSASVISDSRSSLSVPAALTGNKVGHSIAYDGTDWSDNGVWRGPTGINGINGTNANVNIVGTNGIVVSSIVAGLVTTYTVQESVPVLIPDTNPAQTDIPDRLNYSDFGSASFDIRLGTAKGGTVVWVAGQYGFTGVVQGVSGCGVSYNGTLYTAGNIVPMNSDLVYGFVALKQADGAGNWTIMVPVRQSVPSVTSVNGLTGVVTLTIPSLSVLTPSTGAKQNLTNNLTVTGGTIATTKAYPSVTYVSTAYVIPCIHMNCTFYRNGSDVDMTVAIQGSYNDSSWTTLKSQTVRLQSNVLYNANISVVDKSMAIAGTLVYYRCLVVASSGTVQYGLAADHTIFGVAKGGA